MGLYVPPVGDSRFWVWLRTISPYPKALAWCHTTDAFALREIILNGSFRPTRCGVFEEDLFYCFYGRPAYRFTDVASLQVTSKAPVVVLLAPEIVNNGKRMFPFDTGAFM